MLRVLGVCAALLLSWPAHAVQCPAIEGGSPALAAADAQVRLDFIRSELVADSHHARLWKRGWLIAYSTAFVVQGAVIPAFPYSQRWSLYISEAKTAVALGAILIGPLRITDDGPMFDRAVTQSHGVDPCTLLHEGETLLLRDAADEAAGHGWFLQLGGIALNIAGGLVLGLVFHQWAQAAISSGVGILVGETMTWTRARGAEKALALYRSGNLSSPAVQVHVAGTSVVVTF